MPSSSPQYSPPFLLRQLVWSPSVPNGEASVSFAARAGFQPWLSRFLKEHGERVIVSVRGQQRQKVKKSCKYASQTCYFRENNLYSFFDSATVTWGWFKSYLVLLSTYYYAAFHFIYFKYIWTLEYFEWRQWMHVLRTSMKVTEAYSTRAGCILMKNI